jgi:hypothetical protein
LDQISEDRWELSRKGGGPETAFAGSGEARRLASLKID